MRSLVSFIAITACAIDCGVSNAQQSPTAQPSPSLTSISPDKRWEYRCEPYADHTECRPMIVRAGTTEVVLNLDQDLAVSGSESIEARIFWAPDSRRFAFNYSPVHAHHTVYETVAVYQLNGDKWVQLPSLLEETEQSQLAELAKKHLPKDFNPKACAQDRDVLKLRSWIDPNTAILFAPCYGRMSGQLETAFLFTLRFDDAGNWKIIKAHQVSEKEIEKREKKQ
jgi:hypothetical protein